MKPSVPLFLLSIVGLFAAGTQTQLATTVDDFAMPGSQPGDLGVPIQSVNECTFCHGFYDPDEEPFEHWSGSMMANSMRDPVFHASLAIANQDAAGSGELCLRCHAPGGWLAGQATPSSGSNLSGQDYEGVNCNFCHRMVDPIADAANPAEDPGILAALVSAPTDAHNAQFVVDDQDRRRGPFDLGSFSFHQWRESPFHQESLMCGTCHDVSNPAYTRVGGATPSASDTYVLNTLDAEHPDSDDQSAMFPIERTFSEWEQSAFAAAPINMGGRFGGNKLLVSTCQDCHMPDTTGTACAPGLGGTLRTDLPMHDFNGANSWVPEAIWRLDQSLALYGPTEVNGQPLSTFQDAIARNISMLERACDLNLQIQGDQLMCQIVNQTGHKLPTGYGEGRRMWLNVQFLRKDGSILKEHGAYDLATTELDEGSTEVYEIKHGLDATVAATTGLPQGESFHFVLNNTIEKDNRIPPRGFTNANFEAIQAQPVGATYADGQYWDITGFSIPPLAAKARVTVYFQTTSKEYIEFLRDENTTDMTGQIAYDEWVAGGRSAPVAMATKVRVLPPALLQQGAPGQTAAPADDGDEAFPGLLEPAFAGGASDAARATRTRETDPSAGSPTRR